MLSCTSMAKLDASEFELRRLLRPHRVNLEHGTLGACACGDCAAALVVKSHAAAMPADEVRHQTNETESPTLNGFLRPPAIRSPRRRGRAASAAFRGPRITSTSAKRLVIFVETLDTDSGSMGPLSSNRTSSSATFFDGDNAHYQAPHRKLQVD